MAYIKYYIYNRGRARLHRSASAQSDICSQSDDNQEKSTVCFGSHVGLLGKDSWDTPKYIDICGLSLYQIYEETHPICCLTNPGEHKQLYALLSLLFQICILRISSLYTFYVKISQYAFLSVSLTYNWGLYRSTWSLIPAYPPPTFLLNN